MRDFQLSPIELAAVRVEASLKPKTEISATRPATQKIVRSDRFQKVYFSGAWVEAMSFERNQLGFGDVVVGPAIVTSRLSTTIVDPGWSAEVWSDGSLLLTPTGAKERSQSTLDSATADPVQLEIFNRKFSSIASRMGLTLQKTSVSVNVKERLDFSCAIFTGAGDLVVNAPHIPVHLGAMSETVRQVIARNEAIAAGDVFVTNNPFAGGSHLPDVTVVTPVFVDTATPTFWVASRGHHSEIGGKTPGSMPPDATVLAEEGVLIDNFKLIDQSNVRWDELRSILESGPWPSRDPKQNLDDIAAQVAANRIGERELLALVQESGCDVVTGYMKFIQDAAEIKARKAIATLGQGKLSFEDALDNGATIRVAIERKEDSLLIDFTGTDPVTDGNQNANRAIVLSAVMYVIRLLIDDDIPLNEGVLNPVELVLPDCFLNPQVAGNPLDGPAVVGGNVETSQRIVDVLLGAFGVAAASQGTMNNWLMGDETFGYYETLGGGSGATVDSNGADAVHVHMTNTRLTDPEILESRFPVILRECSVRDHSGGAGENNGGHGLAREIEFCRSLLVSLLTNRRQKAPYGISGGGSGKPGVNLLIRDGQTQELASQCQLAVDAGDRLRIETPGGGGFGSK